jgi:regulator of replication initiation timing
MTMAEALRMALNLAKALEEENKRLRMENENLRLQLKVAAQTSGRPA